MTIKYEVGKTYPVRNGGKAVIGYVFESGTAYGIYSNDDAEDYACPMTWHADGSSGWRLDRLCADHRGAFDILPPEPEKRTVWANIGRLASGKLHLIDFRPTKQEADCSLHAHRNNRVGCHRITLRAEFEGDDG